MKPPPSRQGAPRRPLAQGGTHLLLWGTFQRIRKKSAKVNNAWTSLTPPDRKAWLIAVSSLCFSEDKRTVGDCFARAYLAAPDLTLAVLPAMRGAAQGTTMETYRAACYGWHDPDPVTMKNLSTAERDVIRRTHKALAEFVAETA